MTKVKDEKLDDLDRRLRGCVARYKKEILRDTMDEDTAISFLLGEIDGRLEQLEETVVLDGGDAKPMMRNIRLASIDVSVKDIHQILLGVSDTRFLQFLNDKKIDLAKNQGPPPSETGEKSVLVQNTHVTLAHSNNVSQTDINSLFGDAVGSNVDLRALRLVWSDEALALEVAVSETTVDGTTLARSTNDFVHITVWYKGKSAVLSNNLPEQLTFGTAKELVFDEPKVLEGQVSFWRK